MKWIRGGQLGSRAGVAPFPRIRGHCPNRRLDLVGPSLHGNLRSPYCRQLFCLAAILGLDEAGPAGLARRNIHDPDLT